MLQITVQHAQEINDIIIKLILVFIYALDVFLLEILIINRNLS